MLKDEGKGEKSLTGCANAAAHDARLIATAPAVDPSVGWQLGARQHDRH